MSHIKLDISNIYHEVLTIGSTTNSVATKIREIMSERGLTQRDIHRMCAARFEAGLSDSNPSYQTVHKFLAGKSILISYDIVVTIIAALGYEMCGSRTTIEGDSVRIVDKGEIYLNLPKPKAYDRSKNFLGKGAGNRFKKKNSA